MKKLSLIICSIAFITSFGIAQSAVKIDRGQITISSRGLDVRQVLHDVFLQAGKNYILDKAVYGELFLALTGVDFDETVEIICKNSNLEYEVRNDIYYVSKIRKVSGSKDDVKKTTNSHDSAKPAAATTQEGRLDLAVLRKAVNTNFVRTDLRLVTAELAKQAGIRIEVAPSVPKFSVDLILKKSSLGYGLKALTDAMKLEVVFTDKKSILIQPKAAH
ncbi:MAG: hypothetical protein K8R88_08945 [Armatimonadetes bacterium]|nr:hypothetical protein [Armatimonadota bacterium]